MAKEEASPQLSLYTVGGFLQTDQRASPDLAWRHTHAQFNGAFRATVYVARCIEIDAFKGFWFFLEPSTRSSIHLDRSYQKKLAWRQPQHSHHSDSIYNE